MFQQRDGIIERDVLEGSGINRPNPVYLSIFYFDIFGCISSLNLEVNCDRSTLYSHLSRMEIAFPIELENGNPTLE